VIHRDPVFHNERAGERSAGTEGKQVIERFGVIALGVGGPHRVQDHLSQPGLSRGESKRRVRSRRGRGTKEVLIAFRPLSRKCHKLWHFSRNTIAKTSGVAVRTCLFIRSLLSPSGYLAPKLINDGLQN